MIWQTPYILAYSLSFSRCSIQLLIGQADPFYPRFRLGWPHCAFGLVKAYSFSICKGRGRVCGGRKKIDQSFILSLYQPQRWLPELCVYVSVALSLTLTFLPLVAAPLPATYTTTIPSSEERERETRDSIHILDLRACWTLPTYYRLLLPYDHLQKGENARDRACPSNSWVKEGETHTRRYRGEAASSYRQHTLKHRIEKLLKTFLREKFKKKNNNR